jgi:hypothetical protein
MLLEYLLNRSDGVRPTLIQYSRCFSLHLYYTIRSFLPLLGHPFPGRKNHLLFLELFINLVQLIYLLFSFDAFDVKTALEVLPLLQL